MWHGQPINYIEKIFASVHDLMEFLIPMFTEVLSTDILTQLHSSVGVD